MPKIIFWNVGKNNIDASIINACIDNDVDILILAEYTGNTDNLAVNISKSHKYVYTEIKNLVSRVRIFTKYPANFFEAVFEDAYSAIYNLRLPIGKPILLIATHMPSKKNLDEDGQHSIITRLVSEINRAESIKKHVNSLVIGDLNVNPFEKGMIAPDGFHAVMDKSVALRLSRSFMNSTYKFFYNPMWNRLGDETDGPSGTFYYNSGYKNFFWNTFDQVLIRPSLIKNYSNKNLRVITSVASTDLIKRGLIDKKVSDHLPLFINLETER